MSARAVAVVVALAACNTPVPSIHIVPSGGPTQACPGTACTQVALRCDSVMSIRIFDPKHPGAPLLDQCSPVPTDTKRDFCAVAAVDLEPVALPVEELDVQVALFPAARAVMDPASGRLMCPDVEFSQASGFPVEQAPSPALGGRALYHPGDAVVTVTLGCTDLDAINNSCVNPSAIPVAATVNDFPSDLALPPNKADLRVAVGEPHAVGSVYTIGSNETYALAPQDDGGLATWTGIAPQAFDRFVCIDTLENAAATTATLRCVPATGARVYPDLIGAWLPSARLAELLGLLGASRVPPQGLTLGVVIDSMLSPVAGATVRASAVGGAAGSIAYLTKAGFSTTATVTDDTGLFVSTDAAFGTELTGHLAGYPDALAIGGLVTGRVTIAVLRLEPAGAARAAAPGGPR